MKVLCDPRVRLAAVVLSVVLISTGCGGDDAAPSVDSEAQEQAPSQDDGSDSAANTEDEADSSPDTGEGDEPADDPGTDAGPGGLEPGTGRVTVGDMTWDIVADLQCIDFGQALAFLGHAVDDPTVTVTLDANTLDATANTARVEVGDTADWRADDIFADNGSSTPEVTAEDGYGTGVATFFDSRGGGGTAEGSYEFYCG